jgi:hypothetical protein
MDFGLIRAHWMGFTFVTGCLPCLRLLSTPPHGNAVTGHSPLNDVIGGDVVFICGLWFSGARPKGVLFEDSRHSRTRTLFFKCCPLRGVANVPTRQKAPCWPHPPYGTS